MKAPENLVKAVERLKPQAVLLLDTNILMENPRLESYEIAAPVPLLLVIPEVVDNELSGLTFNRDREKGQKASRALKQLGKSYARGNPVEGLNLGNDVWMITAKSPRPAGTEGAPLEDDQVLRYLGQVDAALLRLADACTGRLPNTRTVLVTNDKHLTHKARLRGHFVCELRDLLSPEVLVELLGDGVSGGVADIEAELASLVDTDEKRRVTVSMTLEEIRSESDYLIASGVGHLTYDEQRHSFRWTYPYRNAERVEGLGSLLDMIGNTGVMPVENLDFMGADVEPIPEQVRRFACSMLESAGWADLWYGAEAGLFERSYKDDDEVARLGWSPGDFSLQSPLVRARLAFTYMEAVHWGYYCSGGRLPWVWQPGEEDLNDDTEELYSEFFESCEKLMRLTTKGGDGDLPDFANAYREAFGLYEELVDRKGKLRVRSEPDPEGGIRMSLDRVEGEPAGKLETGLKWLLGVAADSWSVGQTREDEFTYSPYSM